MFEIDTKIEVVTNIQSFFVSIWIGRDRDHPEPPRIQLDNEIVQLNQRKALAEAILQKYFSDGAYFEL